MCNYISQFYMDLITYPCSNPNVGLTNSVSKRGNRCPVNALTSITNAASDMFYPNLPIKIFNYLSATRWRHSKWPTRSREMPRVASVYETRFFHVPCSDTFNHLALISDVPLFSYKFSIFLFPSFTWIHGLFWTLSAISDEENLWTKPIISYE